MWGYGPGMMGYGYGGWGGHMIFGGVIWIGLLVLIVFAIAHFFRSPDHGGGSPRERRSGALDVLEERYARGEIGRDEYLEKRRDIAGGGDSKK